jgi:rubrerythrin
LYNLIFLCEILFLSKMAITSRDPEIRKKYNRVRNQVKSHVNKLKNKYGKDLVQRAKENPKVIWKYIKSKSNLIFLCEILFFI